jgi:hypothetical protein
VDQEGLLLVSAQVDRIEYDDWMLGIDEGDSVAREDLMSLVQSVLTEGRRIIVSSSDELPLRSTLSLMEEYLIMCTIDHDRPCGDRELGLDTREVEGWDTEECSHNRVGNKI